MATKDSEKKQWTDPKDYGLPWVEIKPLKTKESSLAVPSEPEKKPELVLPTENVQVQEASSSAEKLQTPEVKQSKSVETKKAKVEKSAKKEEGSQSWIWVVLILALVLVAVIVLQMLGTKPEVAAQEPVQESIPPTVETPAIQSTTSIESASTDTVQKTVNQAQKEISQELNPNISKSADSGTTIANKVTGRLIRIEAKEERPQYFIVVGSLPNEADALKQVPDYQAKAAEVYLILPYAESKNYRLAIGKYGSFKSAAEALDQIKSQYTEALWILKY